MAAVLVTVRPGALAQLPAGLLADLSTRFAALTLLRTVLLLTTLRRPTTLLALGPSLPLSGLSASLLPVGLLALRPARLLAALLS